MPIYMYKCQSCKVKFERKQLFSDKSLTRCPECHLCTITRIPQLPAIIFKGSGWYSVDHRSFSGEKANTISKKNEKAGKTIGEVSEN